MAKRTAKSPAKAPQAQFSKRSQRSLKAEFDKEQEIKKFEGLVAFEERLLAEANKKKAVYSHNASLQNYQAHITLSECLREVVDRTAKIGCFKENIAGLQKEIAAMAPTPMEAAARLRTQKELARKAGERVEAVISIDAAIRTLRERLRIHAGLTREMLDLAGKIDLTVANDFDSARFERLTDSLPGALQPASAAWLQWFLGIEPDAAPCAIKAESQTFPETLAVANFFKSGEVAQLNPKQKQQAEYEPPRALLPGEAEEAMRRNSHQTPLSVEAMQKIPGVGILGPW